MEHERIGNYRILELIGTGGMGEVYRAEQTAPIRRTVALKIIKRGMDTKEVVARFEAERQALALMDHPNIAKVFDAGSTPHGLPYFAMEYVRGEPINRFCDKQKLTNRERLELFLQLCEGVQHAHQKAIIHRDLKPSNVLVTLRDETPVPKIIDFGVAKATAQRLTEKTMYTALGELIGTPEYMSPEQAEMTGADVDTRTDVYSLGVILYELLVGALPFDPEELRKSGYSGIIRMLREQDPLRPSTKVTKLGERRNDVALVRRTQPDRLGRALRGDLDWITLRALEKNPARRYGSAAELAADLRRHLRHEPVQASPPSAAYRAGKFVRRHRVGVSFAAVVAVLLSGTAVTMTVQAGRIARERDRANLEAERASQEARASGQVTDFLVGLFATSDPRQTLGEELTATQILERGKERLDWELKDQPRLRGRMLDAIGRVYQNMSRYEEAEKLLTDALATRRDQFGENHPEVAKSMAALGFLYLMQRRYSDASAPLQRAVAIQESLLGPEHIDTAWTYHHLGILYSSSAPASGREYLARARKTFERDLGPTALAVSWCWTNEAQCFFAEGDFSKARECAQRALEIKEQILRPNDPDIAISITNVAYADGALGAHAQAAEAYERALRITEKSLGPDHHFTGTCLRLLSQELLAVGDTAAAEKHLERALPILRSLELPDEHSDVVTKLGAIYASSGRLELARQLVAEIRVIMKGRAQTDGVKAEVKNAYAWFLLTVEPDELQDPKEALEFALEACELTHHGHWDYLDTLALAYHRTGQTPKAIEIQNRVIALLNERSTPIPAHVAAHLAEFRAAAAAK